jgi:hypothetical protein
MNHQEKSLTIYGWLSISAALMTIALKSYAYFLTGSVGFNCGYYYVSGTACGCAST